MQEPCSHTLTWAHHVFLGAGHQPPGTVCNCTVIHKLHAVVLDSGQHTSAVLKCMGYLDSNRCNAFLSYLKRKVKSIFVNGCIHLFRSLIKIIHSSLTNELVKLTPA